MKKRFVLSIISVLLVLTGCGLFHEDSENKPQLEEPLKGELLEYEYGYYGTVAYPIKYVHLKVKGDERTLSYSGEPIIDTITVDVGPEVVDSVRRMVISHRLHALAEQYRPKEEVMDGESWSLSVTFTDGSITSGGFNAWPKGISCAAITDYLISLVPMEKGKREEY